MRALGLVAASFALVGEGRGADVPSPAPTASASPSIRLVRQGTPTPGTRVVIGPDEAAPPGTTYRWTQIEGPKVAIADPTSPQIRFTVPADARSLAFSLTVKDASGERTIRVPVPIGPVAPPPSAVPAATPKADAGGDLRAEVGQKVTLDGSKSRPAGRVGYRWIAISGPNVPEMSPDGPRMSFTPTLPGTYRFALIVGQDSQVSEPAHATVEVSTPAPPSPLSRWFAEAVAPIPRGAETASEVADVFESISKRAALYTSYSQLQSELTRRLDVVIPTDVATRTSWSERVFLPLSQVTAPELQAAGIDPNAAERALDVAQKERLQTIYRILADACRPRPSKP